MTRNSVVVIGRGKGAGELPRSVVLRACTNHCGVQHAQVCYPALIYPV
jgi:hypothetical protein